MLCDIFKIEGRERQSVVWWWLLIVGPILSLPIHGIDWLLNNRFEAHVLFEAIDYRRGGFTMSFPETGVFGAVFLSLLYVASVTLFVRRAHDVGWSGRWFVSGIAALVVAYVMAANNFHIGIGIAFIASILLTAPTFVVALFFPSEEDQNPYGDVP